MTRFFQRSANKTTTSPLLDSQGHLLGILTRNRAHPAEAVCALRMTLVAAQAEKYLQQRQAMPQATACQNCGSLTRAAFYGGRCCETCGARTAPRAGQNKPQHRAELARLYGENHSTACPICTATVGAYAGRCLRCASSFGSEHAAQN